MFHFALFTASFMAVDTSSETASTKEYFEDLYGDEYEQKFSWFDEITNVLILIRVAHLLIGLSSFYSMYLQSRGFILTV